MPTKGSGVGPHLWHDRRVPTPKQGIRIPRDRWEAVQRRAGHRRAAAVINAALVLYLRGELDSLLAPLLAEDEGPGQTPQEPSAASG